MAVADVTAREIPHAAGEVAGVKIALDGTRRQRDAVRLHDRLAAATACARTGAHDHRQVQRLHDGGRPADRLGLLRPGPRRPDLQDQERQRRQLRQRELLRRGSSTRTRRTSTTSTSSRPDGTPKMATLGDERQLNDASFNAGLDSGSSYEWTDDDEPPALLRRRQAHRRPRHPALQGRREVARRRRPADARRRAAGRSARRGRGRPVVDLHVPAQEHGRGGRDRPGAAPAGRDRVPDERRLPPLGLGHRHRLDAPSSSTR